MDFDAEFEFGLRPLARGFAEVLTARAAHLSQVDGQTGEENQP